MERTPTDESASNNPEDSSNREEPVETPNPMDESGRSNDDSDQKKPIEPTAKSKPEDQPSSSVSEFSQGDKTTSSEEKLGAQSKSPLESEEVTKPTSTPLFSVKDIEEPTILNLPEIELISISSRIAEANERYLEQFGEADPGLCQAVEVREPEVAVRRPAAEAREHEVLEQRDSVLTESGAEGFDIALHCGVRGKDENGGNEEQLNLLRSRVIIGLLKNEFMFLQQLRFNAELLMQFLMERRTFADDDRQKYNDRSNSPSMPKFNLRPLVPGINNAMDQLQPNLANFIQRTIDMVSKYRIKSPDCNENSLKEYLDLFFDLQERLERLEDLLRNVIETYAFKLKLHKEIEELVKQSKVLHKLLIHSHFKLSKILYVYRIRLRDM